MLLRVFQAQWGTVRNMQFVFHGFHGAAVSIAWGQKRHFLQVVPKKRGHICPQTSFSAPAQGLAFAAEAGLWVQFRFGAPTAWAKLQDVAVMQQAIEHGTNSSRGALNRWGRRPPDSAKRSAAALRAGYAGRVSF